MKVWFVFLPLCVFFIEHQNAHSTSEVGTFLWEIEGHFCGLKKWFLGLGVELGLGFSG